MRRTILAISMGLAIGTARAADPGPRTLTFEDRVAAQKAIEQVYWNHRIWPKENPGTKPPLSAVMSDEAIRHKVEDYIRKSNALARFWQHSISGEQLQDEIDRMVKGSRDTNVLRDLFAALGNDPVLIADTLARQTLGDRLIHDWYAYDDRFHGDVRRKAESELALCRDVSCMRSMGGDYRETAWRHADSGRDAQPDGTLDHQTIRLSAGEWKNLRGRLAALPLRKPGRLEQDPESFSVNAIVSMTDEEISTATIVWPKISFDAWWKATAASLDTTTHTASGTFSITEPRTSTCSVLAGHWNDRVC